MLGQRHLDILQQGLGSEQRTLLPHDTDAPQQGKLIGAFGRPDIGAEDRDPARGRRHQPDHQLQKRGLAAAGSAEDHEYLSASHFERHVAEQDPRAEGGGQVFGPDHRFRQGGRVRHRPSRS